MRLVLDTNAYSALGRGRDAVVDIVEKADVVHLPFVVVGELRAGFAVGTKGAANERGLVRFLALPDVSVLHSTDATSRHYAMLYRQLRERDTPIPTNDLWIAALVVEHDLALYTLDRHFKRLPQLRIVRREERAECDRSRPTSGKRGEHDRTTGSAPSPGSPHRLPVFRQRDEPRFLTGSRVEPTRRPLHLQSVRERAGYQERQTP